MDALVVAVPLHFYMAQSSCAIQWEADECLYHHSDNVRICRNGTLVYRVFYGVARIVYNSGDSDRLLFSWPLLLPMDGSYVRRCDFLYRLVYKIAVEVKMSELDNIIHQPVRLRIMSALTALDPGGQMDFVYLRDQLKVTDGNLGAHLTMKESGYIKTEKTFVARKPRTFIVATGRGRDAFAEHIAALKQIIKNTQ